MPARPVIAITRHVHTALFDEYYVSLKIMLTLLGGRPLLVTPETNIDLRACDALLLSGGADIHPSHYGMEEQPGGRYLPERDALEMNAFTLFQGQRKPILGVCRGMQMINTCLGGTLYQEIADHFENTRYPRTYPQKYFFRKPVNIEPDTRLASIFKKEQIMVNRLHHQAIDQVGKDLKVSAIEPKGIIQGIDHIKDPIFGIQWHPELLHFQKDQWRLFKYFINLC